MHCKTSKASPLRRPPSQHVLFSSILNQKWIVWSCLVTFWLAYCANDGSSKSESVGVLLPPALASLVIQIEARVWVMAFAAHMNTDHWNYSCVALTFENSKDHHLVLASEMLRIVRHLPAAATDTYTWHHLGFWNYRSAEQREGEGHSYRIERLHSYPVPNVQGRSLYQQCHAAEGPNCLNTSLSDSSFLNLPR